MKSQTTVKAFKNPERNPSLARTASTGSKIFGGAPFSQQDPALRPKNTVMANGRVPLSDNAPFVYRFLRSFMSLILNTFFRDIEVIGLENVPLTGGVIIAGNHFNQFVDGLLLVTCCPRVISFLMAAKSFSRPVVGWFAKKFQAIPVVRPQDSAVPGKGKISANGKQITGVDTHFTTDVEVGGSIMIPSVDMPCKVKKIISDVEMLIEEEIEVSEPSAYKILKKVDQKQLYDSVYSSISNGGCIGIFPEGGSHDRTNLLPLKAGIAVMSLGYVDKYKTDAVIIPCGFTYFEGHRFRSQVVIEFGLPIKVTPDSEFTKSYGNDRRAAYNLLLESTRKGLEAVTITASSYEDLSAFHLARRLFQTGTNTYMTPSERAHLTRIFLNAYRNDETHAELDQLKKKLLDFKVYVSSLGFDLHQIKEFHDNLCVVFLLLTFRIIACVFLFIISFPGAIISCPIIMLALYLSLQEMKHAKATSNVKVKGKDVIASYKIVVAFVLTPIFYMMYLIIGFVLVEYLATGSIRWIWPAVGFAVAPIIIYVSIKASEKGVFMMRSIRPLMYMANPFVSSERQKLLATRKELEDEVVTLIHKLLPSAMEEGDASAAANETRNERNERYEHIEHNESPSPGQLAHA